MCTACLRWLALVVACSSTRFSSAGPVTSGSAPLFACGSNDEASADTLQVISVFNVAKTVCCDQLHEQCDKSSTLPLSCDSSSCARVVDLVEQSCKAAFADGFLRSAFKPQLDPLITTCNAATKGWKDRYPVYVVSDPALKAEPVTTCHGRLVDGTSSGFSPAATGQDAILLQAPEGMQVRVTAEVIYMPPHGNVRIYDAADDWNELGLLSGTSLPQHQHDREFVSSTGALRVLRVVHKDDLGLPLVFSFNITCVCTDMDGCGDHGSCVDGTGKYQKGYRGTCQCQKGYSGAMCEKRSKPCCSPICESGCCWGTCDCRRCEHCNGFCGARGYCRAPLDLTEEDGACDCSC